MGKRMKLYDITLPITNGMPVWPGDPPVSLFMNSSIANGDEWNMTSIQMGAHTGTHVEAPYHFFDMGGTLDSVPIETFIGSCFVVEVNAGDFVTRKDIEKYDLGSHERILIKTKNSRLWADNIKSFNTSYVSLGLAAARYLVERKTILVGIDYLSIEDFKSTGSPVHKLLLENNITILEGLNLSGVQAGAYELLCMPLKLQGCEAAPARVLLRQSIQSI